MLLNPKLLILAAAVLAALGCSAGRHSSAGFRLPDDGDIQRGQVAFVEKGCHTCHRVAGVDLPKPTVDPAVPVVLGGEVSWRVTDGYLTTSIINPSYSLARYPRVQTTTDGAKSRMPHYTETLTTRELTDIVAFLQHRYVEVHPTPTHTPF
jgi:mono/diheme cytochrome c family protein